MNQHSDDYGVSAPKATKTALLVEPFKASFDKTIKVGGDKSISHRAVILASLAIGRSHIEGLSKGDDVQATKRIMRQLGVDIKMDGDICVIDGLGLDGLHPANDILDCGNSGTTARLMLGVLTGQNLSAFLTGDESLRRRSMTDIVMALSEMGAFFPQSRDFFPLTIQSSHHQNLTPIEFEMKRPSAQLKSALILAGLHIAGETAIIENRPTRDHTEYMIKAFGGALKTTPLEGGAHRVSLKGEQDLKACDIQVPSDPSSAAFLALLALLTKDSHLKIEQVCANPHRLGFYRALQKMGADIDISIIPMTEGRGADGRVCEPSADITIKGGQSLYGIDVSAHEAVALIDEYPILSIAAACAEGTTNMRGLSLLRNKESDRLSAIAENLNANGVQAEILGDDLTIIGSGHGSDMGGAMGSAMGSAMGGGGRPLGGGRVQTYHDHRIAMAFLILGALSQNAIIIDDGSMISTSFPDFFNIMRQLGIVIKPQ